MGLYDELSVTCPKCQRHNFLQSKAGDCTMKIYNLSDAPYEILKDMIKNTQYCEHCNCELKFKQRIISKVYVEEG